MQRTDSDGVVIACDFCRRDWDGQEAMIEGHHGSVICLQCLKRAVNEKFTATDKYACTLCLRYNIPSALSRWQNPDHPEAIICDECMNQAAKTFEKQGFSL